MLYITKATMYIVYMYKQFTGCMLHVHVRYIGGANTDHRRYYLVPRLLHVLCLNGKVSERGHNVYVQLLY